MCIYFALKTSYGTGSATTPASNIFKKFSYYAFNVESFRIADNDRLVADEIDGMTKAELAILEDVVGRICFEIGNDDSTVVADMFNGIESLETLENASDVSDEIGSLLKITPQSLKW
jgi:hypothetical protein